uniref:Uncharacterized protein n=1 Tax=Anguilla anguilla TaxID=7936 RepID=A0A0E9ULX4_ANGAN
MHRNFQHCNTTVQTTRRAAGKRLPIQPAGRCSDAYSITGFLLLSFGLYI